MGKSSKKSGPKVDSAAVVAKPSPKSLKKGRAEAEEAIVKKSVSAKKQKVEAKKIPEKKESSSEEEEEDEEVEDVSSEEEEVEDASSEEEEEDVLAAKIKTTKADDKSAASKTLYVGNLPYSAEKSDVEEFFQSAGEIVEVRLAIKDGKFRGFGHVEFATEAAAEKALAELNGRDLLDRAVRLEREKEGKSKDAPRGEKSQSLTVFVRGFAKDKSEDQIRKSLEKHFGSCGEVTRVAIPKDPMGGVKGIAYLDFKDSDACASALELNGSELGSATLYVDQAKPRDDSGGGRGGGRGGRGRGGRGGGGRGGRGRGGRDNRGGRFGGGGGRGRRN
ncbi:hypothetical protein ACS0TY_004567 [Phlomoides rotata]